MVDFKFPRNPGTQRENPFEDSEGKNLFSEQPSNSPASKSLYGTSTTDQPQSHRAGDFVTMLPSRPKRVLTFGVAGLALAAAGILVAAAGIVRSGDWSWGLSMGMSFQFIGLAASLPAWFLGANDLKAMRAGAMDAKGRRQTRIGFALGVVGVLIGPVPILLWVGLSIAGSRTSGSFCACIDCTCCICCVCIDCACCICCCICS